MNHSATETPKPPSSLTSHTFRDFGGRRNVVFFGVTMNHGNRFVKPCVTKRNSLIFPRAVICRTDPPASLRVIQLTPAHLLLEMSRSREESSYLGRTPSSAGMLRARYESGAEGIDPPPHTGTPMERTFRDSALLARLPGILFNVE